MINQLSNNKPSGYQSVDCDAGIPISGRTASNGSYQILKLSDTGSLLVQSGINASGVQYQIESNFGTPTGALGVKATGIFLGVGNVISTAVSSGWYNINPSFIAEAITGGSVNLMLVKIGTILETYATTLNAGSDSFNPTFNDISFGGLACVWHNNLNNTRLGTNLFSATGGNANTLEKTVYLEAGSYSLIAYVDTAITTAGTGQVLIGLQNLIQVA
jgi:hypothetical protein